MSAVTNTTLSTFISISFTTMTQLKGLSIIEMLSLNYSRSKKTFLSNRGERGKNVAGAMRTWQKPRESLWDGSACRQNNLKKVRAIS